jgi:rfaE bifunctional protein nucleotidyltransferase chain/domain
MVPYTKKHSASELVSAKIFKVDDLLRHMQVARFLGKKVIFTNGCFDLLHRGHIDYLCKASDLGDDLYVGLNSDASVKRQSKGPSRPLQDEQSRAMILASLHFVKGVVLFDEDTPLEIIQILKPDVLVKGADYSADEKDKSSKKYIVGSDIVTQNGGVVKTIEFLEGYSTTAIEKKIRS